MTDPAIERLRSFLLKGGLKDTVVTREDLEGIVQAVRGIGGGESAMLRRIADAKDSQEWWADLDRLLNAQAVRGPSAGAQRDALTEIEGNLLYCPVFLCLACLERRESDCRMAPSCWTRRRNHDEAIERVRALISSEPLRRSHRRQKDLR